MVEGPGLVAEALAAGWRMEAMFVASRADAVAGPATVPVHELAPNVLERVASTESPQPVLAVFALPPAAGLPAGCDFVVAADRLSDPGNAGTIIRSAEAAGAQAVVLTPGSVDPFNPKVVRASAGSLFRVPVVTATLDTLRAAGLRVLATSSHHGEVYTDVDLTGPVAVVVGNEAHGVADDAAVDGWVSIPQAGQAESLNVAMAATVLAFEVARQRRRR
ncbi:MAG: RNA methyltransferase [Ilumatobacteraceae bacterium]|nr:RNA methyltransferase [Ilumatobacter sp.]MCB0980882.1 RNA methyltransferase [Ilumatobacter sp.]MCO5332360.1 RNA methyltransferase [Ilumatobacteraceae bacterium]